MKNKIHLTNNVKFMNKMNSNSIDLIFVDPPYNMQLDKKLIRYNGKEFDGVNDDWDKYNSFDEYDKEVTKWLKECLRILKKDGSLWVIGSFHNIHRIGNILQNLGAWIINEIVWEKSNPVPNFHGTRFVNSQETMLWVTKNKKSKYTFNYKTMKEINGGKQMKSVWNFPISSGNERLKDDQGKKVHTTQKPLKLLERIILATSKYGDTILDPFSGTGTTAHACKKYGRNYIGLEQEVKYVDASIKRLSEVKETKETKYKMAELDIKPLKVTFKELFKNNFLKVNDIYTIDNKNIKFKFLKSGEIKFNDEIMTPNQFVKNLYNKPTNAWNSIKVNGVIIGKIRDKYRNKFS